MNQEGQGLVLLTWLSLRALWKVFVIHLKGTHLKGNLIYTG